MTERETGRYRGERGRAFPDDLELADLLDAETAAELEAAAGRPPHREVSD